jgi:hypothetical protein
MPGLGESLIILAMLAVLVGALVLLRYLRKRGE